MENLKINYEFNREKVTAMFAKCFDIKLNEAQKLLDLDEKYRKQALILLKGGIDIDKAILYSAGEMDYIKELSNEKVLNEIRQAFEEATVTKIENMEEC